MNAKTYLLQIKRMEAFIQQLKAELEDLKSIMADISAVVIDDMPVTKNSPKGANFEKKVVKVVKLQEDIEKKVIEYAEFKHKIVQQIQSMNNTLYAEILYKRYVEGKSLNKISKELNYAYIWIRQSHGKALKEFEEKVM